ncbi:MAG TPA: YicC family protein [Kiritimatiellia bacterium]|nr:YicC family protein [Kiritimatiellia bacterium]
MTLVSMTGYGQGSANKDGVSITAEVSSVNRKQLDIVLNLPRSLQPLEAMITQLIRDVVHRGRVSMTLSLAGEGGGSGSSLRLDEALARSVIKQCRDAAGRLGVESGLTLADVLRIPGVLVVRDAGADVQKVEPLVRRAVIKALTGLREARGKEGEAMARECMRWITRKRKTLSSIRQRAPGMVKTYRKQLQQRIQSLAGDLEIPADRLEREVVLFADRSDIHEEIARLESHFDQADSLLHEKGPVGRNLDFLAQEILREINTIGSKCSDPVISRHVVNLKADLERFREQVQNVE